MSSFREQLGEDWLRFQHHLDRASPSTINTAVGTNQSTPHHQTLPNGLNTTTCPSTIPGHQPFPPSVDALEVLPPPLLSSEPMVETDSVYADQETESTLQWPLQSTLEDSTVDGQVMNQGVVQSPMPSPESQRSARAESGDTKEEEEEEDLGGRVVIKGNVC